MELGVGILFKHFIVVLYYDVDISSSDGDPCIVVEKIPVGNVRFKPMDGRIREAASLTANMVERCKVRLSLCRRTSANPTQIARRTLILAVCSTLE